MSRPSVTMVYNILKILPMTHFTPDDVLSNFTEKIQPKALTLEIIRQIAHAYHGESKTDKLVLN